MVKRAQDIGQHPLGHSQFDPGGDRFLGMLMQQIMFTLTYHDGTANVRSNACFFCKENRPHEQKTFDSFEDYDILVNPYPVLPNHLTIPFTEHEPQMVTEPIEAFIKQFMMIPHSYAIFYNGALCGSF